MTDTATAPAPPAALPPLAERVPIHPRPVKAYDPEDTRTKVRLMSDYLSGRFIERHDAVELLMSIVGAGEHVVLYGPPGTGKTELVVEVNKMLLGSKFFKRQCFPTMPVTSLIGNIDIIAYEQKGDWKYNTEGRAPKAHFVVLDEAGRLRGATQDAFLALANEREMDNGNGTPEKADICTIVGTSNTLIEDDTGAFVDRFVGHMWVDYIRDPRNREKLMRADFERLQRPEMDFDQLLYAICYLIPAVVVPQGIFDNLNEIHAKLASENIVVSDRRLRKIVRLLQSHAFMVRGAGTVEDSDLAIVQWAISADEEEQIKVRRIVTEYAGATEKAIAQFTNALSEIEDEIAKLAGASDANKGSLGGQLHFKLKRISTSIDTAIEEARRESQPTAKLESTKERAALLRREISQSILN